MKHKAVCFPFLICAMIPPFAALRWNPTFPIFLPEEIPQSVKIESVIGNKIEENAFNTDQIDLAALAKHFSPPAAKVKPMTKPKAEKNLRPPRNNPDAAESSDTPKPVINEKIYLGIIKDENNIAYIFHRDVKSGDLISVKEEP